MLRNYFKITIRNLFRNKGYSFINIFGLAIGMACTILILLWVQHELSYDRFHENADLIYRINKQYQMGNVTDANSSTPYPLAGTAKESFAEISEATKITSQRKITGELGDLDREDWYTFSLPEGRAIQFTSDTDGEPLKLSMGSVARKKVLYTAELTPGETETFEVPKDMQPPYFLRIYSGRSKYSFEIK